jgi:hypothetical protein
MRKLKGDQQNYELLINHFLALLDFKFAFEAAHAPNFRANDALGSTTKII